MDRQNVLAENPVEQGRGFMPAVSVNPSRVLFTAGLTGRTPDGAVAAGGMAAQTSRACERLQAILTHAGASFSDVIKQLVYVTDFDAYNTRPAGGQRGPPSSAQRGRRLPAWWCVSWPILPCSSR